MLTQVLAVFLVFAEPGFPTPGLDAPLSCPTDDPMIVVESAAQLIEELTPDRVLVWRHGGAFPAEVWPALVVFLEEGGSFLHLGGEPFTRPVTGSPGARIVQPRTVSLLKELNLNRSYRQATDGARHVWSGLIGSDRPPFVLQLPGKTWVAILEPRLSESKRIASEDGSDGPREAIVRPLSHIQLRGDDPRFPAAAGALAIDRLAGRFAGGRWVFRLLSNEASSVELARLKREAARPATDIRLDPRYGCFHAGEEVGVTLRFRQPRPRETTRVAVALTLTHPDGRTSHPPGPTIKTGRLRAVEFTLPGLEAPGLYQLQATIDGHPPVATGFWLMDEELFTSGDELTFDGTTLRRDGEPEPVVGSTVMSATVHRQFLFEPDALVWDRTFREMAELDLNLTRTGVWTGFDRILNERGEVDEAWLRALEAYYLSARRHGIPVVFTFFAFVPPAWGGSSPYFDPVSLAAQKSYVGAVAARFAGAREMMWDLINEPSFASPDKLWRCRPHGGRHERTAFRQWLQARFGAESGPDEGTTWQDVVRARWRLLPDDEIGLPTEADFGNRYTIGEQRPYRAMDWLHFAQDAFADWCAEISGAIRAVGSTAAITVGQDEGGLVERPSPLFHHDAVDYTSIHTWWNNEHLLWDGIMAKAPGQALLVSETGIMQRELLSGESLRDLVGTADLLSRKIGHAFAAGACGLVEWVYDVNPYMPSDNEVAIGLRRVDGSYKPEHRVLREFAAFVARNRRHFTGLEEPEVAMVVPFGGIFGPRDLEIGATRRVVDAIVARGGQRLQAVAEYRTAADLGAPRLIVLPSTSGISAGAWRDILAAVEGGSVLHCSGWFENDDAGLPAERLGAGRRPLALVESVDIADSQETSAIRFPLAAVETGYAADHGEMPRVREHGAGTIRHHALPLDWAAGAGASDHHLAASLAAAMASAAPSPDITAIGRNPGLTVVRLEFSGAYLFVAVNEASTASELVLRKGTPSAIEDLHQVAVPPGVASMVLVDNQGGLIDLSHPPGSAPRSPGE